MASPRRSAWSGGRTRFSCERRFSPARLLAAARAGLSDHGEPKDLEPSTQPTAAYLSYDAANVYVAFVCTQPRGDIRARLQKREDLGSDDVVGVYLDTFHDRQRAYFFFSSPVGIQGDGVITETSGEDYSFDTQWSSDGRVTDDGYVVLITVPFKAMRFPVRAGSSQDWGLGLVRSIRANNESVFWPANTQRLAGLIAQFATADGIAGVSPGRNIQFVPHGTFTGARFLDDGSAAYARKNEWRAGVDIKLVPRDALTLDFTINPDFSQVESDEPQVTVNQRFEVFFQEKRPFFLENADFFAAPLTLFFSRRIRDPQVGARMTGKYGKWATGALVMDDRAPGHDVEPGRRGFEDRAVDVVGSARRDFANQSNVGLIATSRTFAGAGNQVAGASTHLRLDQNWFLDVHAVGSHDTDVSGDTRHGAASFVGLIRNGRAFYRHALLSETVGGVELGQREDLVQFSTSTLRWLSFDATALFGTRPNYTPAGQLTPFLGDFQDVAFGIQVKPVSRLSLSETLLWNRLDGRDGTPAEGARIFENRIVRSRANYQFTREWSLRAILDYNSLDPNVAVFHGERSRHFGADVLLTWLAHPGTAFYIGYTDGYDGQRLDPTRRELMPDGALRSTGRQLFVKSSWLLRF
ncbi:MAG: DUF5916 domain-containing protein [Vicinamibacteraceae bacterium]